jgi:hypothetical protein
MRAIEFEGTLAPNGQISLPPEIASKIPAGEQIRIVVMWNLGDDDNAWRNAGQQRFQAAYAPEDDVYEQLAHASAIR